MPEPVIPQAAPPDAAWRAATAELHREMCGCAASVDTGESEPWCDSIWPVRARRIVAAALPHLIDDAAVERAARALYERRPPTAASWENAPEWHVTYLKDARTALLAALNIETMEAKNGT